MMIIPKKQGMDREGLLDWFDKIVDELNNSALT
jgi:hypothetical protein